MSQCGLQGEAQNADLILHLMPTILVHQLFSPCVQSLTMHLHLSLKGCKKQMGMNHLTAVTKAVYLHKLVDVVLVP